MGMTSVWLPEDRERCWGSKAAVCLGRHNRQRARRRTGIGSDLRQLLMKRVVAVLIEIQRQVHGRDQQPFRQPGLISLDPDDIGVVGHPGRQLRLAGGRRSGGGRLPCGGAGSQAARRAGIPRVSRNVDPEALPAQWLRIRCRRVCWLAGRLLAGGALGAIPPYSRVRPSQVTHWLVSMGQGSSRKYQPYTPGRRGTGFGRASTSPRDHRRAGCTSPSSTSWASIRPPRRPPHRHHRQAYCLGPGAPLALGTASNSRPFVRGLGELEWMADRVARHSGVGPTDFTPAAGGPPGHASSRGLR